MKSSGAHRPAARLGIPNGYRVWWLVDIAKTPNPSMSPTRLSLCDSLTNVSNLTNRNTECASLVIKGNFPATMPFLGRSAIAWIGKTSFRKGLKDSAQAKSSHHLEHRRLTDTSGSAAQVHSVGGYDLRVPEVASVDRKSSAFNISSPPLQDSPRTSDQR